MSTIGRYVIERELGRGAMGVVYLARDPHLSRQVAVKTCTLPEGISEDLARQFHERFLREARAAASLSHPGIVTVHDAGEDEARHLPYIAMEYVQGETLKQHLERGERLDPGWVVDFGAVLADALQVAHRAGIVHRDIKPANILIRDGDKAVKIADFGVARLKESDLTQSGATIGSPGYMSPEQIRGGALDGRSDLFSLAVVLYEALCGKRPFRGNDLVSLAFSIAHDTQVPLARQMPGCPPALDRFFDRALSKDPGQRFPDGAAFREALLMVGRGVHPDSSAGTVADAGTIATPSTAGKTLPATAGPAGAGGRRFRSLGIAAVALVAVGLVVAAYLELGRPSTVKAGDRGTTSALVPPAGSTRQEEAQQRAGRPDGAASHRESSTADASAHERETANQEKAVPRSVTASSDVEPAPAVPKIPRSVPVTVPAGTEIHLTLDRAVGSASSHVGDTFTARIAQPVLAGDRVAIPTGSSILGRVSEAVPAKKGLSDKAGTLSLSFERVATAAGFNAPLSAGLTRTGSGSGKKNAEIIGGSAAGGALLGKVLGGSNKKAALGSVLGGAIGTGVAANTKGEDVELPAGTPLTVTLDRPVTIKVNP